MEMEPRRGRRGKPFKPGKSGNPKGRPSAPADLKAAKLALKADLYGFELLLHRLGKLTMSEIATVENQSDSENERLAARLFRNIERPGGHRYAEFILNVVWPVPKSKREHV